MERNLPEGCRLISLSVRGDERGSLIPLERATGVPFDIARVYFIYEEQVFAGGAEFLTKCRPDVVCEILPGADQACRAIAAMVRPLGYRTFTFEDDAVAEHAEIAPTARLRDWLLTARTDIESILA